MSESSRSDPGAVTVPQLNPNDDSAVLVRWHLPSGGHARRGQALVTFETTKATFDVEAPREGYVFYDLPPKTMVAVGRTVAWICQEPSPPSVFEQPLLAGRSSGAGERRATRKAARLMREHGLSELDFASDLARIEETDVERLLGARGKGAAGSIAVPDGTERLEQSAAKMIEVRSLEEVYRFAIPSTIAMPVSCKHIAERLRLLGEQYGPVSLLELVIFELSKLLHDFPELNGYYSDGQAYRHRTIGIGFAINAGRSLRVPVVRCDSESTLPEAAAAIRNLFLRYMREELTLQDLTGGTFTVTDLSSNGVVHFVPVLNLRQSAILGLCAERAESGTQDLVLTFDHRMSDGMQAAEFLGELRGRLEAANMS
jgi:pyruvate/2-oxoglutarate dehydrogenase complex dihydrolipoamide acyltransferase (E2) component